MRGFLVALQFLTILPLEIKPEIKEKDFGRALIYFPIVGAVIGLVLALVLLAFDFLPHLAKIALVLTSSIIITGAMHLDGFADTCDGFFSGKSKEKILNIMHDPHIGTIGTTAVVSLLLLKFSLMASISKDILWKSLIMMAVFSRWIQVLVCYLSKYAKEFSKARFFIEYASLKEVIIGGLITVTLLYVLESWKGLFLFIPVLFTAFLLINYIKRRIGGMTGDTIGAVSEIVEVCVLLFSLILFRNTI
jgi:adenosylcobinamide-GDP ribazoletransferase